FFFFFQAEDGIRDFHVTGVQTCALPICRRVGVDAQIDLVERNVMERRRQRLGSRRQAVAEGVGRVLKDDGQPRRAAGDVVLRLMVGAPRVDVVDALNDGPGRAGMRAHVLLRAVLAQLLEMKVGIGRRQGRARPRRFQPLGPADRREYAGADDRRFHVFSRVRQPKQQGARQHPGGKIGSHVPPRNAASALRPRREADSSHVCSFGNGPNRNSYGLAIGRGACAGYTGFRQGSETNMWDEQQTGIFLGASRKPDDSYQKAEELLLKFANRHGIVTGATGTGKTVTLQILAEGFSNAGVPVFCADIKGDLAGVSMMGEAKDFLLKRAEAIKLDPYEFAEFPVIFWDLFG